jgi:hypothetical protein
MAHLGPQRATPLAELGLENMFSTAGASWVAELISVSFHLQALALAHPHHFTAPVQPRGRGGALQNVVVSNSRRDISYL